MKKLIHATIIVAFLSTLFVFCISCDSQTQNSQPVIFMTDGEIYDTVVPTSSYLNIPTTPTKDGYLFDGWFFDDAYNNKLTTFTQVDSGKITAYAQISFPLAEELHLYARWKCLHTDCTWIVDIEDTCSTIGKKHQNCNNCGQDLQEQYFDDVHHTGERIIIKEATCSETGEQKYTCDLCGDTITETIELAPHSYSDWVRTKEPSCSEVGKEHRTCSECGHIEERNVSQLAHDYDSGTITKQPTCEKNGIKTYTCRTCGATKTSSIAKLNYHIPDDDYICTVCGKKCSSNWEDTTFVFPSTPLSQKDYGLSGKYSKVLITNLTVERGKYGGYYIYISGEKDFDNYNGATKSSPQRIGWKLFDLDGAVVYSGTLWTSSLCVGDKFKNERDLIPDSRIEPGKTYWLEILDVGN